VLEIINAEAMTGDEGITQRSGAAQVKTQSLYYAGKKFMID